MRINARLFIQIISVIAIIFSTTAKVMAQSNSSSSTASREFLMSCTYGTLAGTLVGAASLGFEQEPGKKLNRIAQGASLGLYAGILLGLYVVYIVPGQMEKAREERLKKQISQFDLSPTFSPVSKRMDGAVASYRLFEF